MTIDIPQDTRTLDEMRRAMEEAENEGDPAYIADLFAEDAGLMVPDFPVQEGKAACAAFIRGLLPGLLAAFDRRVTYTSAEVRVLGDLALDRGTFFFTVRPRDGSGALERVTGKYLWLYQRDPAGVWKCARMIVSRDEDEDRAETPNSSRPFGSLALPLAIFLGIGFAAASLWTMLKPSRPAD